MKSIKLSQTPLILFGTCLALLSVFALAALPQPASALSCLNPIEMIPLYATDDSYTVAVIEAVSIETEGDMHDQEVIAQEVFKGELSTNATVSFAYDETWSYLCAGTPAEAGSKALYVIRDNQVVQVFTPDSEFSQTLSTEIEVPIYKPVDKPVMEPETPSQTEIDEEERKGLMKQIIVLLQKLVILLSGSIEEIKVAEPLESYVGMTTIEAVAYADSKDELFRVVEIDGVPQAVTEDYRIGRINAAVENNVVTSYTVEGQETEDTLEYIGLTATEAEDLAEANDVMFRVGMIDDEPLLVTMDYVPGRITATIKNDIVVDYTVEGGDV